MEKYKVCPLCGTHNPPIMLECTECESDLSSISIVNKETEKKQQYQKENISKQSLQMIRICECGTKNPIQIRKCQHCGEDISDIIPTQDAPISEKIKPKPHFILSAYDNEYIFEIQNPNTIIGREYSMKEYLHEKFFVSRKHAEICYKDEKLFIKNLSRTNFTYINNQKINSTEFIELKEGDEIGLGGIEKNGSRQPEAAYFIVRTKICI